MRDSVKPTPVIAATVTLVSAAVIVYHNALSAYFFDDDFQWLVGSWSFHSSQLLAIGTLSHFYRPVIDLYFAAATPLFRGSPVLFHLASILLHAANALVIFALARLVSRSMLYGFLAALFFVVQPSDIDAIAWVGALAEAVGAFFGCLSLFVLPEMADGRAGAMARAVGASVSPGVADARELGDLPARPRAGGLGVPPREGAHRPGSGTHPRLARHHSRVRTLCRTHADVPLCRCRREQQKLRRLAGHYTVGLHVVRNALDYIDALYVGRRDALNYAAIAIGLALLILRGNRRVQFATCWMLLALAPFLFFNWGNTSRYLYQPAIGFSMLLAEGVIYLDRVLKPRAPSLVRSAILTALVAGITVRFAVFAMANVASFTERTQTYRNYAAQFREIHGDLPSHTTVAPDARLEMKLPHQFANAAVQWEYRDPDHSDNAVRIHTVTHADSDPPRFQRPNPSTHGAGFEVLIPTSHRDIEGMVGLGSVARGPWPAGSNKWARTS
jgi:hypothetical protein